MSRPRSGRGGRAGRARCCAYVDHVLALLPFEPEAYRRLRGPPCSYVGHPLTEQLASLRPGPSGAASGADESPPVLLVLPGSRRSEIRHHMAVFGQALGRLQGRGRGVRTGAADHAASAGGGRGGAEELAGAAARRDRRAGEAGGVPDRACGAGEIRHRDAGTCAGGRADGDGLPDRRGGGLDLAAGDQGEFGDPGQSRDRRERRSRIPAGGLHAGKAVAGAARGARRYARCGESSSRRSPGSTRSCRPATSRPARAPPISCWRRCGRRGERGGHRTRSALTTKPDAARTSHPAFGCSPHNGGYFRLSYRRSRGGRRRCRAGADGRSSAADPRSSRSTG